MCVCVCVCSQLRESTATRERERYVSSEQIKLKPSKIELLEETDDNSNMESSRNISGYSGMAPKCVWHYSSVCELEKRVECCDRKWSLTGGREVSKPVKTRRQKS